MTWNVKFILALSGSASILLSPIVATANTISPCDASFSKDAVHCAYASSSVSQLTGKYIKVKVSEQGHPAFTKIFCATASTFPLMNIPQSLSAAYTPGNTVNWQFSQCTDEDCSASQTLLDDKFTITTSGDAISSGPKSKVEVQLNPAYGVNCDANDSNGINSENVVSPFIQDTIALLRYVPKEINQTINLLTQMENIATQAANGTYSSTQLFNLNTQYQAIMSQIDKVQRVNTLSGVKKVNGGALRLSQTQGNKWHLNIPVPVLDLDMLNVRSTDTLSVYDAETALPVLQNALGSIYRDSSSKA